MHAIADKRRGNTWSFCLFRFGFVMEFMSIRLAHVCGWRRGIRMQILPTIVGHFHKTVAIQESVLFAARLGSAWLVCGSLFWFWLLSVNCL